MVWNAAEKVERDDRARELGPDGFDVETVMIPDKQLADVSVVHVATGLPLCGLDIHPGRGVGRDRARPFAQLAGQAERAVSATGRVMGSDRHGMFRDDPRRAALLGTLGASASGRADAATVEASLDALPAHLEPHRDVAGLLALARSGPSGRGALRAPPRTGPC